MTDDPYLAFSRFGLGPRPGDLSAIGPDAKAALIAELADPTALFIADADLPGTVDAYTQVRQFQQARKMAKQASAAPSAMAAGAGSMSAMSNGLPAATIDKHGKLTVPGVMSPQDLMNAEIAARLDRVRATAIGFGERLVGFWANHFAVQAAADEVVRGLAGAFEREAIRPYVLGKFGDMALAATQHPAMLMSLNNATSIGPNSPQGKRSGKGLNENHARELMELHTVGVDAGYAQADVTSFAKVLTGWTFGRAENAPEIYGRFVFRPQAHEPGPQTVMGKTYPQKGLDQGLAVIADLAAHPATAQHIALQLARYFVADAPAPTLVKRLADTFRQSGGDLRAVTLALVNAPEAWSAPADKLRLPQEFLWSAVRALDLDSTPNFVNRTLADLGQPLWNPPSPQGFKDDAATWLAPDAMTTRLDTAELMAAEARGSGDPRQLAADLLGTTLSADTRTAIDRAESRTQAIALLLMSPEFQRR
ncbi:MAG: DUF1800 domain-containing protein [Devosia sp.]|nr:DUF1800 domain-containing protein [Devosia sp.]